MLLTDGDRIASWGNPRLQLSPLCQEGMDIIGRVASFPAACPVASLLLELLEGVKFWNRDGRQALTSCLAILLLL